jgi:hypothetical protein
MGTAIMFSSNPIQEVFLPNPVLNIQYLNSDCVVSLSLQGSALLAPLFGSNRDSLNHKFVCSLARPRCICIYTY